MPGSPGPISRLWRRTPPTSARVCGASPTLSPPPFLSGPPRPSPGDDGDGVDPEGVTAAARDATAAFVKRRATRTRRSSKPRGYPEALEAAYDDEAAVSPPPRLRWGLPRNQSRAGRPRWSVTRGRWRSSGARGGEEDCGDAREARGKGGRGRATRARRTLRSPTRRVRRAGRDIESSPRIARLWSIR